MRIKFLLLVAILFITSSVWASSVFSMEPDWRYLVGGQHTQLRIEPLLLNDDLIPDLVVGNSSKSNLTVFYGVGDGSFTAGEEYPFTDISWIESGDIDNDGDIDVLARQVTNPTDSIFLYLNDGMGLLDNPIKYLGPGAEWLMPMFSVVDIDSDTFLDLVTISLVEDVYAMLGDGEGGFNTVVLFTDVDMVYLGFDCDDVDGDGDVDIVIICPISLFVLLNNGDGSFTWNGYFGNFNAGYCGSLDIGLLNEDSFQDIASVPGGGMGDVAIVSFLGDGQGAFSQFSPGWYDGYTWNQTDIGDYDLDGFNDAFFTGDGNFLMLGDGTGNLSSEFYYGSNSQCFEAAVADFDLDGDIDFVTATGTTSSNFYIEVFLNKTIQVGIEDSSQGGLIDSPTLAMAKNPVSGYAEIILNLPLSSQCLVSIFDIQGRQVETIKDGNLGAGEHILPWDSRELPLGCYTVLLTTESDRVCSRFVKVD